MVRNTLLNYILIMSFLFKTRSLYIQTYSSLVTIASTLAMTTYFSIKFFNQELLSRFLCVCIGITISKYQIVFTCEHVSSCVCIHVHTRMYIDIYCKYIVFNMLNTLIRISNFMYTVLHQILCYSLVYCIFSE